MRRRRPSLHASPPGLAMLAAIVLAPSVLAAQDVEARASALTLGGRLQVQYANSSVEEATDDAFLRRARLGVDAALSERLEGRLQADFAGGGVAVKDAWARYTIGPGLRVSAGQFKRPFSAFELSSSTDLPIIERDGRIEGVSTCPGVGGVCTFSRLSEKLRFDDRDLGVLFAGEVGQRFSWAASVTNGAGADAADSNDAKSLSARLEFAAAEGVVLSAFGALHDHLGEDGDARRAPAFGADVEVGTWRDGPHLLAAVVAGENWAAPDGADFLTAQALATYYLPVAGRLAGIEPLLRVGWASVEGGPAGAVGPAERALLITPGVMLYVEGKNGLAFNFDVYDSADADAQWSFKVQSYLYF